MSLRQEHDAPAITCGIKYWTANERQCQIPDENISAFRYYERRSKNLRSPQGPVCQAKRNYTESHSELWLLPSKRSDRLADCVRELDSILNSNAILHVRWAKQHKIQLMVNSGLLVNILLSEMNDIQKIFFDKSLILKTPPETGSITGAMITDKFCLLCYDEKNKLAYVSFMQRPETPELKRMTSKISSMDMKISFHDIPGTPMQRGCRKLCLNNTEDVAICWCSSHMASPPSSDPLKQERVNMILLNCSFGRLEVSSCIFTESNLVYVEFSKIQQYQVHSLERTVTSKNEISLQFVTYECTQSKMQRLDVVLIPVKSGVLSCSRNRNETKLAIGCTDGTILVYNLLTRLSCTVRDPMVPSIVSWHPDGGVIMIASGSAELKCYDSALGMLTTSLLNDVMDCSPGNAFKLSQFLPGDNGLVSFLWPNNHACGQDKSRSAISPSLPCNTALVLFDGGPFAFLKFNLGTNSKGLLRPMEIIREHVTHNNVKSAVNMLHTVNWSAEPENAFLAMTTIFNHLLKQPLSFETEELLEGTLSSFYAPKYPITEAIIIEYRHTMSRYARRFFHHLLEFGRFEKAFLLAKDIQDRDLFVDIYFNAKKCGETVVAKAAKQKMIELYSSSEEDSTSEDEYLSNKGRRKVLDRKEGNIPVPGIFTRRSKVTSSKMRKEVVPSSYPPPKMDDFMASLMSETKALKMNGDNPEETDEILPRNVVQTGSTLKILDYGYV